MPRAPKIYVVRAAVDQQLVGIFSAAFLEDLFGLVDEAINVDAVEFCEIETLALIWPNQAHPVPLPESDDAPLYDGMMFSELMDRAIEESEWRRIPESVVYFISDGRRVKIGVTRDLPARLRKLQTGNPLTLSVVKTVIGDQNEEYHLHERFAAYRLSGEWFRIEGDLASYLKGVDL